MTTMTYFLQIVIGCISGFPIGYYGTRHHWHTASIALAVVAFCLLDIAAFTMLRLIVWGHP